MRSRSPRPAPASMRRRLADHDQVEVRVVELSGTGPRPDRRRAACSRSHGKRSPALRRAVRQAAQRLRQGRSCDSRCRSARRCGRPAPGRAAKLIAKAAILARILRAQQAGKPVVRHHQPEGAIRRVQQRAAPPAGAPLRRSRAALVSAWPLHDQRQLPGQVVGVLQAGVHALRADRAVDVRRVAEQEAAAVAEARRAAVVDAVGGEPGAGLDGQVRARLAAQGGNHVLDVEVAPVAQAPPAGCRRCANDPCRASETADGSPPATGRR